MHDPARTASPGIFDMIVLLAALVGGIAGAFLLGSPGGFWAGAAVGALAGRVHQLQGRVRRLELRSATADPRAHPAAGGAAGTPVGEWPEAPPPDAAATVPPAGVTPSVATDGRPAEPPRAAAVAGRRREPAGPGPIETAIGHVRRWFTTGNVPVKVGVVLSVFGVGFLVKEAIDRNWMVLPIELRLILVAAFGLGLLALGWRLRTKQPVYAVSVQGGGVAVLYVTIYASFALYALLPAAAAFAMLLIVTAAVGTLAVLQNARALAVLGVVGGFMAPVLTSSGTGDHVALFGYYALLNAAVIGIAWFRSWRELNVLGFFFTFVIGSLWGYTGYRAEHFWTTEPFLILFVLMYTFIPVLFAHRQTPRLKGFVDGTLVFGTPVVGFALQTRLVGDTEYGLAFSAVALAAMYVAMATVLFRRHQPHFRVLIEALLSLGVVFATIAVPLALDARWTSAAWALEGAALVWLGLRQQRRLALAAGALMQLAAGAVHFAAHYAGDAGYGVPILNGALLGALLIAAAGVLSGWLADRSRAFTERMRVLLARTGLAWGAGWWFLGGLTEVGRHVRGDLETAAGLAFIAASVAAASLAARRVPWPRLAAVGFAALAAIVLGAAAAPLWTSHPLADLGWIAWPALFGSHALFARLHEDRYPAARIPLRVVAFFALVWLAALEAYWQADRLTDGIWAAAAGLAVAALLVAATLRAATPKAANGARHWPFDPHRRLYETGACGAVLAVLVPATLALNLSSPGAAPPLPFVPLLNPLELASALVALVALGALRRWRVADAAAAQASPDRLGAWSLAALALALLTMSVARTVHHWADVPFDFEALARSTALQAALSIVWGTAALSAMLAGARAGHRAVWLAGAGLMAVVVVKLFVVELGSAGTVGRVVSFLGVGLLLLVVGYFAPAPPRDRVTESHA